MDLFDSDEDKKTIHEELESDDIEEHTIVLTEPVPEEHPDLVAHEPDSLPEDGQSLLQTIIMIIGGIILVILLVLFARWIYHKIHHNDNSPTSGTVQLPEESYNPGGNQSGTSKQPSNQNPGSSSPSSNSGKSLPNNGPGNVIAIFAGSTLAAAGLHYIISVRRFSKYGD